MNNESSSGQRGPAAPSMQLLTVLDQLQRISATSFVRSNH